MRITVEDTVALVIDYQEKLVPVMMDSVHMIHNAQRLIQGMGELGIPLYVTQQYTKGLGETVDTIREVVEANEEHMMEGVKEERYIEKISFSAFSKIQEKIKGKKYVIVCGIEAHICVLQTVIDLAEAGYIPVLVVDCISSRKQVDKQYGIERAKQEGAIVTTYEAILFELLKMAGTDQSKKIQKLIR